MTQENYNAEEETEELIRVGKLPKPLRLAAMLEKTMQGPLHGKAADCLREMYEALQCYEAQPQQEPVAWISHNAGLYHFKPDESLNPLPLYISPPQRKPLNGVLVPLNVLEAAEMSLGSFCSDHGWADEDMQNMDSLSAYIAQHKAAHGIKENT